MCYVLLEQKKNEQRKKMKWNEKERVIRTHQGKWRWREKALKCRDQVARFRLRESSQRKCMRVLLNVKHSFRLFNYNLSICTLSFFLSLFVLHTPYLSFSHASLHIYYIQHVCNYFSDFIIRNAYFDWLNKQFFWVRAYNNHTHPSTHREMED